jgi:hypothetical protein
MTTTEHDPAETEGADELPETVAPQPMRRRQMAAGHVVLVMFIALAVGTLLNADKLMQTAQGLPLGTTKRSVAVTLMGPVHWVADHLGITEPHRLIEEALGKSTKHVKDPFSEFAGTTPSTAPALSATKTSTPTRATTRATVKAAQPTVIPRFHPTAKRPLRIYVAGDSLSFEYGLAIGRLAASHPYLQMEGSVDYHVATGLARPDVFNWPQELQAQVKARKPDVVIFMVGSNDDQALQQPNGKTYRPFELGWSYEYSRRAAAVMDQLTHDGVFVIWVGIPIIQNPQRSQGYLLMDSLVNTQAAVRPNVRFINPFHLFADKNGNYQEYMPDPSGQLQKMRADDGIHFERAGGDLLGGVTLQLLQKLYPPAK